jgi:hypothetical protein
MPFLSRSLLLAAGATLAVSAFTMAPARAAGPAVSPGTAVEPASRPAQRGARAPTASQVEQRIAALHARLHIEPAQQPQWDGFTQVMRANAQAMDDRFQRRMQVMPTMSAAENMQSYAHLVMEHGQDVQRLTAAFGTLYASLSDQQKHTLDRSFRDDAHRGDPTRAR